MLGRRAQGGGGGTGGAGGWGGLSGAVVSAGRSADPAELQSVIVASMMSRRARWVLSPSAYGTGTHQIHREARILLGLAGGAVAAWCGDAGCAPCLVRPGVMRAGRPVCAEDRAVTEDSGNLGVPKLPGKPDLPRSFSRLAAGLVAGAGGVAVVAAGCRAPDPQSMTAASIVSRRAGRCSHLTYGTGSSRISCEARCQPAQWNIGPVPAGPSRPYGPSVRFFRARDPGGHDAGRPAGAGTLTDAPASALPR